MSGVVPDAPLIVAANRDERLDRPAVPMTVLKEHGPRILGGQDHLAGGTWLAVNEHGVVAGLTNQPSADGRDPSKQSRGELPIAFARYRSATEAVDALAVHLDPAVYNPCWLLVGDRDTLYFVGISGRPGKAEIEQLGQGLYVLENAPLRPVSAKAAMVTGLITDATANLPASGPAVVAALERILGGHERAVAESLTDATGRTRRPALSAPCVHADGYGTRSAMTVCVPASGGEIGRSGLADRAAAGPGRAGQGSSGFPIVHVADGRPCEAGFIAVTALWGDATVNGAT